MECMLEHGGFLAHEREKEVSSSRPVQQASLSKAQDPQLCDFKPHESQNYSNSLCCFDPTAITRQVH